MAEGATERIKSSPYCDWPTFIVPYTTVSLERVTSGDVVLSVAKIPVTFSVPKFSSGIDRPTVSPELNTPSSSLCISISCS